MLTPDEPHPDSRAAVTSAAIAVIPVAARLDVINFIMIFSLSAASGWLY
jgi:hypothetical protein